MKSNDIATVESVLDLTRYCNGYHILLLYLIASGYSQVEISQMLGISRQALNDEMILIREQYRAGRPMTYRESKAMRRNRHDL